MDVVLIKINRPETVAASPPLGLLYLSKALKSAGFSVRCMHVRTNELQHRAEEIMALRPLWVGFTVFSGDCMAENLWMARTLKAAGIVTVWGNAHPTLCPEQCLAEDSVDICALSEGEETAIELTQALKTGSSLRDVAGLVFKDACGGIVRTAKRSFMKDLDAYGPDMDALDLTPYIQDYGDGYRRTLPWVASRGCPHACGICYNEQFNDRKWRRHSPEFAASMIAELSRRYDIDSVRFMDDYLFASKRWAFDMLRRLEIPWRAAAYPSDITDDFLANLAETRCYALVLEIESVNDRVLDFSGKKFDRDAIVAAVRRLSKLDHVAVYASIIFAYPTETEAEFSEALELTAGLMEMAPNVGFTCGWYRPYPGTPLWTGTLAEGFRPPTDVAGWDILDRWEPSIPSIDWVPWADIGEFALLDRYMEAAWRLHRQERPELRRQLVQAIGQRSYLEPAGRAALDEVAGSVL